MNECEASDAVICPVLQALVDALLARWNTMPAAEQPDHLAERMEELFLEASMLEAVCCAHQKCGFASRMFVLMYAYMASQIEEHQLKPS